MILLALKRQHEAEQFRATSWVMMLSKAINFLIVNRFHFLASGVFHCLLYVLQWFILEAGALRYKANNSALYPNTAKIIYLLCLPAPPSFSNMKRSRYDFPRTASSAAASVSYAYKSRCLSENSWESSAQNMADKNDRNSRGGGSERPGLYVYVNLDCCFCWAESVFTVKIA